MEIKLNIQFLKDYEYFPSPDDKIVQIKLDDLLQNIIKTLSQNEELKARFSFNLPFLNINLLNLLYMLKLKASVNIKYIIVEIETVLNKNLRYVIEIKRG
jgi:hypothetical protein